MLDSGFEGFADLRAENRLASLTDDDLLEGERDSLVLEILSALDRNGLGADGAPVGPYAQRTEIIPGVLSYDPTGGASRRDDGEDDENARPPSVFGGLTGF